MIGQISASNKLRTSSELAPNMFGASSELASVMEFGFNSDVPAHRPAALPRDECQTIRSIPVRPEQTGWLLCYYCYFLFLLWPPCVADTCTLYFCPVVSIYLAFFFFSPNVSGRRLDVYHTSTHGVALVRI